MIEPALVVIKAQQKRTNLAPSRSIAEASHHAIGGAHALHFQHRTLTRLIWSVTALGDDSIQRPAGLPEPGLRNTSVFRIGGKLEESFPFSTMPKLEGVPAFSQRPIQQTAPRAIGETIEQHQLRRGLACETRNPAFSRMQTHLQCVEGENAADWNNQLSIQHQLS